MLQKTIERVRPKATLIDCQKLIPSAQKAPAGIRVPIVYRLQRRRNARQVQNIFVKLSAQIGSRATSLSHVGKCYEPKIKMGRRILGNLRPTKPKVLGRIPILGLFLKTSKTPVKCC